MERNEIELQLYYGALLEIYGGFLTDKQYEYMALYYLDDFSLSEIAEKYGVSRTAIHNQIQTSIQKFDEFEKQLHVFALQQTLLPKLETAIVNESMEEINSVFIEMKTLIGEEI